jgi:hypothetical protein
MTNPKWSLASAGLASVAVLTAVAVACAEQQGPAPPKRADRTKAEIEVGIKTVIAPANEAGMAPAAQDAANPRVQPGKVNWHKDFATARAAAARSGKPVLLFQMMGKLDEQFC